jgi:hypothetical protein
MKKHLLLITLLASEFSNAQITLNSSDFPSSGDMYLMSDATAFQGMDETQTGANFTWDFSQLSTTTIGQHTDTFFDVSNMNFVYQFVFGDLNILPNRSNQATHGSDFSLGAQIAISAVYNFYYNNSNDYHQSGFGAEINGIPAPTAYSPHDVLYKFPVQFGNTDSSASGYSVSLPSLLYYGVNRNRTNEVDGWGTLITPSGTYNVLRLKSTIHEHDSVYLDTLGFGYGFNVPPQIEYKWLGQGEGEPLLQVNAAGGLVTSVVYKGINATGITAPAANSFEFIPFPNPASEKLFLKYTLSLQGDVKFSLLDVTGNSVTEVIRKSESRGDHLIVFDLPAGCASGNYFVKMTSGNQSAVKPVTISR